jgi:signal peptidase II
VSFSIVALAVVCYLLWNSARRFTWNGLALALILGGAVGNLYDRVVYGRVTDFLHCYIGTHSWPDFNLADSAIVTGTALLIVELLWGDRARAQL